MKKPRCWRCKLSLPEEEGKLDGFYLLSALTCGRCKKILRRQGMKI